MRSRPVLTRRIVRSRRSCVFQAGPAGTRAAPKRAPAMSRYVSPARRPSSARSASASLRRWCWVRRSGARRLGRPVAIRHRRAAATARARKFASRGMTAAVGVLARAPSTSTAASRSSTPLRSQYSPSATTRLNAGVRRLTLLASANTAGAGVTTTAAGSKRGSQISGALSPRSCGSTGKPEPPASC
jgi:hypothetical protein